MDSDDARAFKMRIAEFLEKFAGCFEHDDTNFPIRKHAKSQLLDADADSVESTGMLFGSAPNSLHEFIAQNRWEHARALETLARSIMDEQASEKLMAIIGETSILMKQERTVGVNRQRSGKAENSIVTVNLSLATGSLHAMIDSELYLPKSWDVDRVNCREAGVPDEMCYRPKWQLALELLDRATQRGLKFECLIADSEYGSKPEFHQDLDARNQQYVLEIPKSFKAFAEQLPDTEHADSRPRKTETQSEIHEDIKALRVSDIVGASLEGKDRKWQQVLIKETDRGPCIREYIRLPVVMPGSRGGPGQQVHLLVVRVPEKINALTFFISNFPATTPATTLLRCAHSRPKNEHVFQQLKQEFGYDCNEGQTYLALKRDIMVSCISYYILSRERQRLQPKYPEITIEQLRTLADVLIRNWQKRVTESPPDLAETLRMMEHYQRRNLAAKTSHTKTTMKRLISKGIEVSLLPRCDTP